MGETLEALHRLQEVELQLAAIRRKREVKARRVEIHKRRIEETENRLEGNRRTIRERQAKLDALQLDVATRDESIKKHREALNSAKTNKEYGAILSAMNTEKADNAKLESGILELMEQIQALEAEGSRIEEERQALANNVKTAEEALREFDAGSRDTTERLEQKREDCSAKIAPTTLASFTRVAEHHDGEAMSPVMKLHPKRDEYACEGCNMKVTLEIVNALRVRDEIQLCPVCGRILYFEQSPVK